MPPSANATEDRPRARWSKLELEMPAERLEKLDDLVAEAGLDSRKELISQALTVMAWAVRHRKLGHALAAVDHRSHRMIELSLPALDELAAPGPDRSGRAHRRPGP